MSARWINAYARDSSSFVLHVGLITLLLWLSDRLKNRIADQMRSAWRASTSKYGVHAQRSELRSDTVVAQKLIYLCLFLIVLYPVPGWFGYPIPAAPEALQTFINSITQQYFRFFAIAILITMCLMVAAGPVFLNRPVSK